MVDGDWGWQPDGNLYAGAPGVNGAPPCGFNTYAPEGQSSADIVAQFANDHDHWQTTFFTAWEKMQLNGYRVDELTEAPPNGQLLAPLRQ